METAEAVTLSLIHISNATKIIPASGCALGIDIGSTSTDLVLVGADGELVDFQYLRTCLLYTSTDFDEHFAKISSYIVDTLHGVPL